MMSGLRIKKVWVDRRVEAAELTRKLLDRLAGRPVEIVENVERVKQTIRYSPDPIGESKQNLFITAQKSFIRRCPCTPGCLGCGYWTIDLDLNCPFDCSYCILQDYLGGVPLTVSVNREQLRLELEAFFKNGPPGIIRIGTGELADSLALEELTGNAVFLIEMFKGQKRFRLELKSKASLPAGLLQLDPADNVVFSWSLNPQAVINSEEKSTAGLEERLLAADEAASRGFRVGFHFDPVLHYPGWSQDYEMVVASVFRRIPSEAISWVSLGSLRFPPNLLPLARRRFPGSQIFEHEFSRSSEGKFRYPRPLRQWLYKRLAEMFARFGAEDKLYLCMESVEVWREFLGKRKKGRQKLAFPFPWQC